MVNVLLKRHVRLKSLMGIVKFAPVALDMDLYVLITIISQTVKAEWLTITEILYFKMIKVVSGFQTGSDLAGIDFGRLNGLDWGGFVPLGRRNET